MYSVLVAQKALVSAVNYKSIFSFFSLQHIMFNEFNYLKNKYFNDEIAQEFLEGNFELSVD